MATAEAEAEAEAENIELEKMNKDDEKTPLFIPPPKLMTDLIFMPVVRK